MKKILTFLIVVVLAAGIYFFLQKKDIDKIEASQFAGNLMEIKGNILTVEGTYLNSGKEIEGQELKEVSVQVTENTIINREAFKVPDTKEVFYPDQLPKETTTVNIAKVSEDSLSNTLGMVIEANTNILGQDQFVASKITYRVPIFSQPR